MALSPELIGLAASTITALGAGAQWVRRVIDRMREEQRTSEKALQAAAAAGEARCRAENAALVSRVVELEDRTHRESRDDQRAMLKVMEMNASAFRRFAEKLPDTTPPHGTALR